MRKIQTTYYWKSKGIRFKERCLKRLIKHPIKEKRKFSKSFDCQIKFDELIHGITSNNKKKELKAQLIKEISNKDLEDYNILDDQLLQEYHLQFTINEDVKQSLLEQDLNEKILEEAGNDNLEKHSS